MQRIFTTALIFIGFSSAADANTSCTKLYNSINSRVPVTPGLAGNQSAPVIAGWSRTLYDYATYNPRLFAFRTTTFARVNIGPRGLATGISTHQNLPVLWPAPSPGEGSLKITIVSENSVDVYSNVVPTLVNVTVDPVCVGTNMYIMYKRNAGRHAQIVAETLSFNSE